MNVEQMIFERPREPDVSIFEWDHTRVANGYEFPPLAEGRAEWERKYGPQESGLVIRADWPGGSFSNK